LRGRLLAYDDALKIDLELFEQFDPAARYEAEQTRLPVVLERAYVETLDTCDAFVTRGLILRQRETDRDRPTLEVTSERWETIA
jgi:hypothetical protein